MSLMQLLLAGRSLKAAKDRSGPYRLPQQNLLPRFGPTKPAGHEATPAPPQSADSLSQEPAREIKGTLRGTGPKPTPIGPACPVEKQRPSRWRFWFRKPFRPATPTGRHEGAIQGELMLDGVRVVRNDLCDADLELVPARQIEPAAPAKTC